MYAIVKTGGKQYRVEQGQTLLVERLAADEGSNVALEPILYRSEEAVFDTAGLEKVKVMAKVLAHERGEKLRVFKFKPKRGYKRRTGHRQELTRIEVTDISMGAPKRTAAKPAAARPAAAKPVTAKKPRATKPPTKTNPAAAGAGGEVPSKAPPNPAAAGGGEVQEVPDGA